MQFRKFAALVLGLVLAAGWGVAAQAQGITGEGSPSQRLEIMRSRLDSMRRSLDSAITSMNAKTKGDEKTATDDPGVRLRGLEKEVGSVLGEVNDLRSKLERSERVETRDLEKLETSVTDLNTRVQSGLQSTATARAAAGVSGASAPPQKKKKKGKFLGLFGGGGDDKYADLTDAAAPGRDRELFESAAREVRKGNYDTGRLLFGTIITTYPDSPFLPLSKLAIADSYYLEGETSSLIQAGQAYQDWLTFFPTDPLSDRVMLKIAEAEMRQMGLPDREMPHARKAEQRLKAILQQFPSTPLKQTVESRLYQVQENLGMHNLLVARFYQDRFERGLTGPRGAQSRLQEIIEKYPQFSGRDESLFREGWLYLQVEEPDTATKYFQELVRDFPNSDYAEKAKEELSKIGAPIPDPDPIKVNMPKPEKPGMMSSFLKNITGSADVTVDKDGVLISRGDNKEKSDLIDEAIAKQGQLPSLLTPQAIQQRRAPARTFPQGTNPAPGKGPSTKSTAPVSETQPATIPTTNVPVAPTGTKP